MHKWVVIPMLLALLGCQSLPEPAPGIGYELQPIPDQYINAYWLHQLDFNQQVELLVHVEFGEQQLSLVALSSAGLPVAQLQWDQENGLTLLDTPTVPLDWQQVLRDIQWIHWPLAHVQSGMSTINSVRQVEAEHGKISRQIYAQDELVAEIFYQGQSIFLQNKQQHYELRVTLLNPN